MGHIQKIVIKKIVSFEKIHKIETYKVAPAKNVSYCNFLPFDHYIIITLPYDKTLSLNLLFAIFYNNFL